MKTIIIILGILATLMTTLFVYLEKFDAVDKCLDEGGAWHHYSSQCIKDFDALIKKEILEGNTHIAMSDMDGKAILTKKITSPAGITYMLGQYKIDLGDSESTTGTVIIGVDNYTQIGDISGNADFYKYLIPFSISEGGSGNFWHLGLFEVDFKDHKINLLDSLLLGDRVTDIASYIGKQGKWVTFNDYSEGQSFADKPNKASKINLTFDESLNHFTVLLKEHHEK
jgi:hypothetical protein